MGPLCSSKKRPKVNRASDPAVAACNNGGLVAQIPAPAMPFVLGFWPRLHFVRAASLSILPPQRSGFFSFSRREHFNFIPSFDLGGVHLRHKHLWSSLMRKLIIC
jgi:hypothetical protein